MGLCTLSSVWGVPGRPTDRMLQEAEMCQIGGRTAGLTTGNALPGERTAVAGDHPKHGDPAKPAQPTGHVGRH
jgi:hypothetical protein